MPLSTRPLHPSDFQAICGFARSAEELFYIAPYASYPWVAGKFGEASTERLSNTVFTEDGAVMGFANFYDVEIGQKGFIGNVIVNPLFRRRGFGKQIVCYMIELGFQRHKFTEVHLSCFSGNTPGLLLYRKLGFRPYAIEQRTDYKNEPVALVNFRLTPGQYAESGLELDQVTAKLANV